MSKIDNYFKAQKEITELFKYPIVGEAVLVDDREYFWVMKDEKVHQWTSLEFYNSSNDEEFYSGYSACLFHNLCGKTSDVYVNEKNVLLDLYTQEACRLRVLSIMDINKRLPWCERCENIL